MELYNANNMPLSNDPERRVAQEKLLRGEPLTMREKIKFVGGHDNPRRTLGDYVCKPDHCYRGISQEIYNLYKEKGYIYGFSEYLGEIIEPDGTRKVDNGGIDWYLGGAGNRYGNIIIEVPAYKEYFEPNFDNGFGLSSDLNVRHMKSSGIKNPIPFSMITNVFDLTKIRNEEKAKLEALRLAELQKFKDSIQSQEIKNVDDNYQAESKGITR